MSEDNKRRVITTPPLEALPYQDSAQAYLSEDNDDDSTDDKDTGSGHSVTYQSAAWWNEERIKNNPARKGETQH